MEQTNAIALRAGTKPCDRLAVLPGELEAVPGVLADPGSEPNALLATARDFDHLLGRLTFPGLALGLAADRVWSASTGEPGAAQRDLRDEDGRLYVERPTPLALGQVQGLPVPGGVELGAEELELHPADGHPPDGATVMARWCGGLCAGDYLCRMESR